MLQVPDLRPGWPDQNNNGIRLLEKLGGMIPLVSLGDYRPTDQAYGVFDDLCSRIDAQVERFDELVSNDLPSFNALVSEAQIGPVVLKG